MISDNVKIVLSVLFWLYPIICIVQVFSAIYRYFIGKDHYSGYKYKLRIYLIFVLIYFLLLKIFWEIFDVERNMNSYEEFLMFYILVVPWPLAIYFWKIIYFNKKEGTG
jgi:hypothetical protein